MKNKHFLPLLITVLLFACSTENIETETLEIKKELNQKNSRVDGPTIWPKTVRVEYDPSLTAREVLIVRQEYFDNFLDQIILTPLQPTDTHLDMWLVRKPGRPEGDGDLGETLEEDPRLDGMEVGG
ncbi:hypothetical protein [Aquimarina sp. 2201CG5-10]|uniref:hypothetical protein n=1 Tax=Aquimarina callyspongiae TaxID=3098150 RepID=UPI002AB3BD92|nr:hypothetical protein [Aquimarina sp. 2201CG5-10]MDY8138108.1 hypothetical protein [Aquimarina sp. 2201CG5-10]